MVKRLWLAAFLLPLVSPIAAWAQLDIRIKVPGGADECIRLCKNVVGAGNCQHAYLYHKLRPPVCRLTSDRQPHRYEKGTYGVWSRIKGRWLNARDFTAVPTMAGAIPIPRSCTGAFGKVVLNGRGSTWGGSYDAIYDTFEGDKGHLEFTYDWAAGTGSGIWNQRSIGREGILTNIRITSNRKQVTITLDYKSTINGYNGHKKSNQPNPTKRKGAKIYCKY